MAAIVTRGLLLLIPAAAALIPTISRGTSLQHSVVSSCRTAQLTQFRSSSPRLQLLGVGDEPLPVFKDALQKPRPPYDLAAASGRPSETVFGARAPANATELSTWAAHMREQGLTQMLALLSEEEAAARSPNGEASGYDEALASEGFELIARVDLQAPDAASVVLQMCEASKASRKSLCVHCADGNAATSLVLAQWLLRDYIGGDNYLEACEAVRGRYRHSGVPRQADSDLLEKLMTTGALSG